MELFLLTFKIFGMKLMHPDFWELLFKFSIDLVMVFILIRMIYYPIHKKKDYLFTYFMFNILIFFLCILLNSVKLSIGFAFGLFAIFGVLRYRTEQLPIKEMTYLFLVIAIALLSAVGTMLHVELAVITLFICGLALLLETNFVLPMLQDYEVEYEKKANIVPERKQHLLEDLKLRTGLDIKYVEIVSINFLRDTAVLRVHFARADDKQKTEGGSNVEVL